MSRKILRGVLIAGVAAFITGFAHAADAPEVTMDRIVALAKIYFRDSAEMPMDVAVTTVVTGRDARVKRNSQANVRMVFSGFNAAHGSYSVKATAGWTNRSAMHDSLGGDLMAFMAAAFLVRDKDPDRSPEISPGTDAGEPIVISRQDTGCGPFQLAPKTRMFMPAKVCGSTRISVTVGDDLRLGHYSFDSAGVPAAIKLPYLGNVQILAFHSGVDFQEGHLPGDAKPFLWPREVTILLTTDKGTILVTNRYSPGSSVTRR